MKALFGWRSEATVGTTVGYFVYWFVVGLIALFLVYKEKKSTAGLEQHDDAINEKSEKDVTIMA